ncbi:MAG TPA: glycosyltransferase, partial [Acidimicrobiales bacterium]
MTVIGTEAIDRVLARTVHGWDGDIPTLAKLAAPVPGVPPGLRPRFSVVIPCFNYGRFLPSSVGSVLDQGDVEVEVIIVDDASTDGSLAVAEEMAAADPRIRVVAHRQNAGHVVTFNDGFEVATGEFIVRLDADDLLSVGSLARAAALFVAFPTV